MQRRRAQIGTIVDSITLAISVCVWVGAKVVKHTAQDEITKVLQLLAYILFTKMERFLTHKVL